MAEFPCARCGRDDLGPWRALGFAAPVHRVPAGFVPQGGFDDHVSGFVPLCPECLRFCATCARPVTTPELDALMAELADADDVFVGFRYVDPCTDPTHLRPAVVVVPKPAPAPADPDAPPPPDPRTAMTKWRDTSIGDLVAVDGFDGLGTVHSMSSWRYAGVGITIVFPDGSWVKRRPSAVRRIGPGPASTELEDREDES